MGGVAMRQQKGFTLIELLVVIAIIAILGILGNTAVSQLPEKGKGKLLRGADSKGLYDGYSILVHGKCRSNRKHYPAG
jgi:prepilin-type N-terminal cleavage/methylation domain